MIRRLLAALTLIALVAPVASGQDAGSAPPALSYADGSAEARPSSPSPAAPLVTRHNGSVTITHSASQVIEPLAGVACGSGGTTTRNRYYRVFDLSAFGLPSGFVTSSVAIGIESANIAGPPPTSTVRLHRLSGAFTTGNLTLVASAAYVVNDTDDLSIVHVPISGAFGDGDVLVVEWDVPDLQASGNGVYFGANGAGQTGPTYVLAESCGINQPTDLASLGFPGSHWVLSVTGTTGTSGAPDIHVTPTSLTITESGARVPSPLPPARSADLGEHIPGRIIVRFAEGVSVNRATGAISAPGLDEIGRRHGLRELRPLTAPPGSDLALRRATGLDQIYVLEFSGPVDVRAAIDAYSAHAGVVYAEPDGIIRSLGAPPPALIPNDPTFASQWGLRNTGQAIPFGGGSVGTPGSDLNAVPAWDLHTGSASVSIAVLDDGLDLTHPEFAGRLLPGYDFVNNDSDPSPLGNDAHGTAAAGIAAAAGNNGIGVSGVAWGVRVRPGKVLQGGSGAWSYLAAALLWAADQGADVISMSLGGAGAPQSVLDAVNYAHNAGSVLLASAGNDNTSAPSYPAAYANVISVGALSPCNGRKTPSTCDGEYWWGSNFGSGMDFLAPGTRIHTTDITGSAGYSPGDYTATFNGTSAACPFAAGVAALIRSADPSLTPNEVRALMQSSAFDLGAPGYDQDTGFGRLDAHAALLAIGGGGAFFTVQNVGTALLAVSSVTTNRTWISVAPAGPFTLPPSASQNIAVSVDWDLVSGTQSGTITIASDDPDEPAVTVAVTAIAAADPPDIAVTPSSLAATLPPGGTTTRSLTISNTGAGPLTFAFAGFGAAGSPAVEAPRPASGPPPAHLDLAKGADDPRRGAGQAFGAGGPDAFGYRWIDSNEPGGPTFDWVDIAGSGTAVPLGDDASTTVPLPFAFSFYGADYTDVRIVSNGFLAFGGTSNAFSNAPIPTAAEPNNIIAPYWDDLNPAAGGMIYYQDMGDGRFVVQYDAVPFFGTTTPNTFQAVLYQNGQVLYQYEAMSDRQSATVGIEDAAGTDGLQVAFNEAYVEDGLAVLISLRPQFVTDVDPATGTVEPGGSRTVTVTLDAAGLDPGSYADALTILSNDPDDSPTLVPVVLTVEAAACELSWEVEMAASASGGASSALAFGQGPEATDGLDPACGEAALPPPPPGFEARFLLPDGSTGSYADYRADASATPPWSLALSASTSDYPVAFTWDPDAFPEGAAAYLRDAATGGGLVSVDMTATGSYVLSNPGVSALVIDTSPSLTVPIAVEGGWNMLSVPVMAPDMAGPALFPAATSSFFAYEAGYVEADLLENGVGYWAKFPEAAVQPVTGEVVFEPSVAVGAGWNLVGFFEAAVPEAAITSEPEGIVASEFFGYDGGYVVASVMEPGRAYWVKTSAAGVLLPSAAARRTAGSPEAGRKGDAAGLEGAARLTVTDAVGRSTTLYLVREATTPEAFALPPLPPAGSFDARLGPDRYAAPVADGAWSVRLQTDAYPVTVALEGLGLPLRLHDGLGGEVLDAVLDDGQSVTIAAALTVLQATVEGTTSGEDGTLPTAYALEAAYPNPSATTATLRFALPEARHVRLVLYDVLGREAAVLVDEERGPGRYEARLDAGRLASGLYVYRLSAGTFVATQRLVVAR
jgi:subtilisin family serine protease